MEPREEAIDLTREDEDEDSSSSSSSSSSDEEEGEEESGEASTPSPPPPQNSSSSSSSSASALPHSPTVDESDAIRLKELLNDGLFHSWKEIANDMGLSVSQVRRIAEKNNLTKPDNRDRWDEETMDRLILYADSHKPRDWVEIGRILDRDPNKCRLAYRRKMGRSDPSGPSSEESVESLDSTSAGPALPSQPVVLEKKKKNKRGRAASGVVQHGKRKKSLEEGGYLVWTYGEWKRLYMMRNEEGMDWPSISEVLTPSDEKYRSPESCQKAYERILRRMSLCGLKEGTDANEIDFKALRHGGGRSWSIRELHQLEKTMIRSGKNIDLDEESESFWLLVASNVVTRTAKSCRQHWIQIESEKKEMKRLTSTSTHAPDRTKWRYSDDIQIVEQYNQHKGVWKNMKINPMRGAEAIRSRFRRMIDEDIVHIDKADGVAKFTIIKI